MSKGVKPIHVIRQEIVILRRTKLMVAEGVFVAIRVKYSEPKFN